MTIINTTNGGGAKTIAGEEKPSSFPSEYPAPEGYDGWSKLTIEAPDNLSADNIRKDVEIAGVTGTYEPALTTQEGTITEFPMTYTTPEGFYGMSTVIAHAPETLVADNIKKGVDVAGITGTYEPALQVKGTRATSFPVIIEPDSDYYGLEQASVTAPENLSAENIRDGVTIAGVEGTYETPTQEKTLKPEAFPTDVTPDTGYALSKVSVTSPDNLTAGNIKKGVEIAGVTGTYDKELTTAQVSVEDVVFETEVEGRTDAVFISTPAGYDGMTEATLVNNLKTTTLKPENIKKGVTIMGYEGTYEAPSRELYTAVDIYMDELDFTDYSPSMGVKVPLYDETYEGAKSVFILRSDSIVAENIKKGVTIEGVTGTYEGGGGSNEQFVKLCQKTITEVTADDLAGVTSLGNYCFYDCSKLASITIPESVTSLGNYCFSSCSILASITIPESVTSLSEYCFGYCPSLTSIDIPESVTSLGHSCFTTCTSLASIDIPESVTSLGNYCFYYCTKLASITIPESVTSLGKYCFYYCPRLASVTMLPTTPPTLGSGAFDRTASDLVITVPKGTLDAYKAATNWSAYADKMVEASE